MFNGRLPRKKNLTTYACHIGGTVNIGRGKSRRVVWRISTPTERHISLHPPVSYNLVQKNGGKKKCSKKVTSR